LSVSLLEKTGNNLNSLPGDFPGRLFLAYEDFLKVTHLIVV